MRGMQILGCGFMLILASCVGIKPQPKVLENEKLYFPLMREEALEEFRDCFHHMKGACNKLLPNDSLSKYSNELYSSHLFKSNEPILYTQRNTGRMSIRFMHLKSWSSPLSYRMDHVGDEITYTFNKTKGSGGIIGEVAFAHEEKIAQLAAWEKVVTQLEHIDFWNMDTHDANIILDGEQWILEVLFDDKYHVVMRNLPELYGNEAYAELCKLVRAAADD